ncbi:MAG: hypothetical protein ACI8VC_001000 [Candidatus Endobugula sp.]|jgi:hypothetical protein
MNVSERILKLGFLFSERLDNESLSFAMDYVNRGENALALDTLLEHLYENDVKITSTEFEEAILLSAGFNVDRADLNHLKELIE